MNADEMQELIDHLRQDAFDWDEQYTQNFFAVTHRSKQAADLIESLQGQLAKLEKRIADEGFSDLETMISKYKTVMLAANEISIEQDEEIETLRAENKNLQKELASLAIESVKREKALAKLEAEVVAAAGRRARMEVKQDG